MSPGRSRQRVPARSRQRRALAVETAQMSKTCVTDQLVVSWGDMRSHMCGRRYRRQGRRPTAATYSNYSRERCVRSRGPGWRGCGKNLRRVEDLIINRSTADSAQLKVTESHYSALLTLVRVHEYCGFSIIIVRCLSEMLPWSRLWWNMDLHEYISQVFTLTPHS